MATVYSKVVSNTNNDLTNERVAAGTIDIGSLGSRAADDVIYTGCKVPEGAIVTEVTWFVRTVCTGGSSSSGTWLLGFDGDSGINNVNEARAMTIVGLAGMHWSEGISEIAWEGADATHDTKEEKAVLRRAKTYHSTQAGGDELVLTLAGQTWTAGYVTFFAKYYSTGDQA